MAQAVACNDHCSIPRRLNLSRPALPSSRCWKSPRRIGFRVRAADEAEECNEEACAPEKEVGKVSMEWAVEERTKVLGTFPPTTKQRWTGYVEKDTAGQTSIYSVEPTMYVADSAISSGEAGTSTIGADNKVAISFGLALIFLAGSSSVLLQVGKNPPNAESLEYSGICEGLIKKKDFSNTSSTISRFEEIIQAYSKEKITEIWINISYPRYMRDMCEDLKGSSFVIMGNWLREKWICNYEMLIFFSNLSCIKESALSS